MLPDPMSPDAVAAEINVVPMNFRKDYVPVPGEPGEFKEVHKVDLVKRGSSFGESTPWTMKAVQQDRMLWEYIEPFYERWLKGQEDPVDGTPLDVCAFIPPGIIEHLRSMQIKSAEDLAAVPDSQLENIGMGARGFRDKAAAYVESKQGDAKLAVLNSELTAENERQQEEIDELKRQVNSLMATSGGEPAPKRRGRPPKESAE